MAGKFRAILDTNVVLAGKRSTGENSPNREILKRWRRREFVFLYSMDVLAEYAEKLLDRGIPASEVETFLQAMARHGEMVSIGFFHFRHYPVDEDDVMFLLCAANGQASHLVSYDEHLLSLRPFYTGEFEICRPLEFIAACRDHEESVY